MSSDDGFIDDKQAVMYAIARVWSDDPERYEDEADAALGALKKRVTSNDAIRALAESWVRMARCNSSYSAEYGEQYAESLLELIGEQVDD